LEENSCFFVKDNTPTDFWCSSIPRLTDKERYGKYWVILPRAEDENYFVRLDLESEDNESEDNEVFLFLDRAFGIRGAFEL